jgi:hypothetical protein
MTLFKVMTWNVENLFRVGNEFGPKTQLIFEERRYSRIYQSNKELIDHIFVSQELLPGQPRKLPVVDSHVNIMDALPSISNDPNLRRGKPGSDHAPITAIFDL